MIIGLTFPFDHVLDAPTGKGLASRNGMELVDQLGFSNIFFESNCLEVIQACNGETNILSPYSAIPNDCFQFAQRIGSVSYVHYLGEANKVVHKLARDSYDLGLTSSTYEEKYHGLPTPEGRMKDSHFQPIFERFTKRLTG